MIDVKITEAVLELATAGRVVTGVSGGTDVFVGTVRNHTKGKAVIRLEFEAYEPMAEREMLKIGHEITKRWPVHSILIHHRLGRLEVEEIAVIIAVSAAHREAAFEACRYAIDTLKQTVPIWKKEIYDGGEAWVTPQTGTE